MLDTGHYFVHMTTHEFTMLIGGSIFAIMVILTILAIITTWYLGDYS